MGGGRREEETEKVRDCLRTTEGNAFPFATCRGPGVTHKQAGFILLALLVLSLPVARPSIATTAHRCLQIAPVLYNRAGKGSSPIPGAAAASTGSGLQWTAPRLFPPAGGHSRVGVVGVAAGGRRVCGRASCWEGASGSVAVRACGSLSGQTGGEIEMGGGGGTEMK